MVVLIYTVNTTLQNLTNIFPIDSKTLWGVRPVWKTLMLNQCTIIENLCSKLINSYVTMLFLCSNAGTSESNKRLFFTVGVRAQNSMPVIARYLANLSNVIVYFMYKL